MPESAGTPPGLFETVNQLKLCTDYRNNDQLGNPVTRTNRQRLTAPVPAGNKQLSLIIRINQADQISQDDTLFMTQS